MLIRLTISQLETNLFRVLKCKKLCSFLLRKKMYILNLSPAIFWLSNYIKNSDCDANDGQQNFPNRSIEFLKTGAIMTPYDSMTQFLETSWPRWDRCCFFSTSTRLSSVVFQAQNVRADFEHLLAIPTPWKLNCTVDMTSAATLFVSSATSLMNHEQLIVTFLFNSRGLDLCSPRHIFRNQSLSHDIDVVKNLLYLMHVLVCTVAWGGKPIPVEKDTSKALKLQLYLI